MGAPMRAAGLGVAAALAAFVSPAAAAAQTVDEIVAKHLAGRGGREALAAVKTLRMTGRASAGPGREAIVRREISRPGKIRTEFVFQGTTGVYAFDGKQGWRVSPLDGSFDAEPLPDDEAAASAEQADIEGPLVDWKAKGHKVELVGTASLPGGPAHELKVTLKSGAVRRVFVDAATGFIVRMESTRRVRGHDVALETDFGDYRKTDGVAFPYSVEGSARGRPNRLRIVVDSVEVNPRLDESRFTMPR
jgi:outer membrane lipoprotein-sorting protein